MNTGRIRPQADDSQPDSQPQIIRARGAMVTPPEGGSPVLQNMRLKWVRSSESWEPSNEQIEFFEPDASTPKSLAEDEECWVIWRYAPRRYEELSSSTGNVIYAQVIGTVTSGTPTFSFDNAIALVGSAPSGGTGTAQNQYAQEYANDEWVILSQRKDNSQWLTERGGTAGSAVITFELTQDKSYSDVTKQAKPVDAAGAIVSGADPFLVVDEGGNFYGKAATGGEDGYRGHALRISDDYADGLAGYRIIDMEGPAHFLTGILASDWSSGGTPFTPSTTQIWGRPSRGKRLPASGSITVEDDDGVAEDAKSGDKWLVAWNEAAENYTFVCPMKGASSFGLVFAMVTGNVPALTAIDGSAFTATFGSGTAQLLDVASGAATDEGTELTAYNLTKTAISGSTGQPIIVAGFRPEGTDELYIVPFDLRSLPGFDIESRQAPYHDEDEDDFQLGGEDCP